MNFLLLSVFMMIVTIIPRILPGFLLDKLHLGKKAIKFLNLIPFTAMSALIFPGVLYVDAERMWIGAVGALIAIALSCVKKMPTFVVVIASVLALVGIYALI
jgi:branched-subunit amino acid transport protein